MLGFFRRFQKFFFVIVTFFIVVSFLFFGTAGGFVNDREVPDQKVGELVDGSPLMERKLNGLIAMLENGVEEGTRTPNLLSGSLVHKHFILPGLGQILAEHSFKELEDELEERWQRAHQYMPYEHPYASHISAQQIWTQFCPKVIGALSKIKAQKGSISKEHISLLFDCYCAQADFPAPALHQMLYYRQQQSEGVRPDPGLQGANVALFGFESVKDWFGSQFFEKMGRFILNAACVAKEQGYRVTAEEARLDLFRNVATAIELLQGDQKPEMDQIQMIYANQIRSSGLKEEEAVAIWQDVLSFKQMLEEVGQGVFFDSLSLDQFKGFASDGTTVIHYQMPESLRFTQFRDMLKFQYFKEIVSEGDVLDVPQNFRDPQEVMEEHPDLVFKRFDVEVTSVTLEEVAARISLKKTWEWEGDVHHFAQIVSKFPALEDKPSATLEERMDSIDQLDPATRFKIDQFARLQLVAEHPEWIETELLNREVSPHTLEVQLKESNHPFSGPHFLSLIESSSPELNRYTVDGETYYRVVPLQKYAGWHFLSFEQAKDVLEDKLDQMLQVAYENGDYSEPFESVQDQIAKSIYSDLLIAIDGGSSDLDTLAVHRFDQYLDQMRQLAIEDPDAFALSLEKPYAVEAATKKWPLEATLLSEGEYSRVENGAFFQLISQEQVLATEEEIATVKKHLALEAQHKFMKTLIESL